MTFAARPLFSTDPLVLITDQTITDILVANPASAAYQLLNTGVCQRVTNSGTTFIQNWISPQSGMSGYEVRATVASGSGGTLNGTTGSWLSLGTSRTWELTESANTLATRVLTIEIRNATTLVVQTSASITLQARST